jgi:general secretion pathway protein M
LALSVLLLALATVASVTFVPLRQTSERYEEAIAELRQRLADQHRMAAAGAALRPRLAEIERGLAGDARYLRSASQTLAAAELQGIVKRVILSKRGEILSTQIVSTAPEGRAQRVTLGVTMRATLGQTVQIFYLLETGDPYLFIDNLSIRSRSIPRSRTAAAAALAATVSPLSLDVELELTGYLRGGPT